MLFAHSKQLSSKRHSSSKCTSTNVHLNHACKRLTGHNLAPCALTSVAKQQQLVASSRAIAQQAVMQPAAGTAAMQQHSRADALATPWRLYICRMPLIGLEGIAPVLEGTPMSKLLQLHTYLLLEGPDQAGVWYLDFLPISPTAPSTGLLLLTGGRAPGEVRFKRLGVQQVKVNDKVRLLGNCKDPDPLAIVQAYNRQYNKELHLLVNNCMHYSNGLTKALLETEGQASCEQHQQQ